jgi:ribulose-phosphate 3-epimerase
VPELRGALDDRADVRHRPVRLQQLRELDAPGDLMLTGVAPSILAADFSQLGEQVDLVLEAGAQVIHVDVMDGHFVPPITMGPLAVEALAGRARAAGALLDVHLMIERPERQIAAFAEAGADNITIHAEATPNLHYAVSAIREAGCTAGVALNPATPVEALSELGEDLDLALCMTVNPGWGGQAFLPGSPGKVERLRAVIGPGPALEVDGGVDARTAGLCAQAGATVFVAGSAVFAADDPAAAFREIADAAGVRPAV